MTRLQYQISERLSPFIESLWLYESDIQGPTAERVIPNGHTQIIIPLGDGVSRFTEDGVDWRTMSGPVAAGPRATPMFIDPSVMGTTVGVHLRVGAGGAFLDSRVDVLADAAVPLAEFWGRSADELRSELSDAETAAHSFAIVERHLLGHLLPRRALSTKLGGALQDLRTSPARPIGEIAERSGLSGSQFTDLFRAVVGLTPARFRRVKRVQKALALLHTNPRLSLALVALRCGYFDQAHFNRDFRRITGVAPRAYLAGRTDHQNHVAVTVG